MECAAASAAFPAPPPPITITLLLPVSHFFSARQSELNAFMPFSVLRRILAAPHSRHSSAKISAPFMACVLNGAVTLMAR